MSCNHKVRPLFTSFLQATIKKCAIKQIILLAINTDIKKVITNFYEVWHFLSTKKNDSK